MSRRWLLAIGAIAVGAAYGWGIAEGDATAVTAATARLVFAGGECLRRRLAAKQYRWDKIAPQFEAFLAHLRKMTLATSDQRAALAEENMSLMGDFGDKLALWGSADVLMAWVAVKREAASGNLQAQLVNFTALPRSMRRE